MPFNFHPFPNLRTQRIQLRQLRLKDDRNILAIRSDKRVVQFLSRSLERSREGCQIFIENINEGIRKKEWIYWGLALPANDRIIGTICLWNLSYKDKCAEIGYELHPDFQRQGLMQEAVEVILEYGFRTMELQTVEAYLQIGNQASIRLLERNQFKFLKKVGEEEKFREEAGMQLVAYVRRKDAVIG